MNTNHTTIYNINPLDDIQSIEIDKDWLKNDNINIVPVYVNINGIGQLYITVIKVWSCRPTDLTLFSEYYFKKDIFNTEHLDFSLVVFPELSYAKISNKDCVYGYCFKEFTVKSEVDNITFMNSTVANECGYFYDDEADDYIKQITK